MANRPLRLTKHLRLGRLLSYQLLFLGDWLSPVNFIVIPGSIWFGIKICIFVILFIWMRAALPRYRYDQLMNLGWKCFLPLSLMYLLIVCFVVISFNLLPY